MNARMIVNTFVLLIAALAVAGCGGRTEVAPSASFDPQEVVRVAVLVDEVKDSSGARSPTVESDLAAAFSRALAAKGYDVATAAMEQRDAVGNGYVGNATPLSDASALRYAGSAGASHALVVTLVQDPNPPVRDQPRRACAVSARMLDVRMRSVAWSASHTEPSYFVTPFDPRDAIREVAAKVAQAIPRR